jgi:hypothetical protein
MLLFNTKYLPSTTWLIIVFLLSACNSDAAIKYIKPGDDVDAALQVAQGDVLVLSPGVYSFNSNAIDASTCPSNDIIIIGAGTTPTSTVLVDFYLGDCGPAVTHLVIQNVNIIGTARSNRKTVMSDSGSEPAVIFRDCIINAPTSHYSVGFEKLHGNYALFNSQLIGYGKSISTVGVDITGNPTGSYGYGRLYLIKSTIRDFYTGLHQNYTVKSENDYLVIAKSDLSKNNRSCDQPKGIGSPFVFHSNSQDGTCSGTMSANTMSTTIVMIPEFSHDHTKILWVKFTGISTNGHTTFYLLPSEYPPAPSGVVTSLAKSPRVLYFQLDTTAVLSNKPIIMINRAFADSHFDLSTGKKIYIYAYSGGKWVALTTSLGTADIYQCYSATWPSNSLGLVALFAK